MKSLLLFRQLYDEAFKAIGSFMLRNAYKAFFWFCFFCYAIVLYAFIYRIATGFAFD
ncbi:DUF6747 family protein [Robiginitalea sp. IMCC43444]|uniref:DUF6747 family protein n=1 Tax=Robiginitalea sp. IMCC43444 TaxID=3459121 RepID=UPI0040434399